MNNDIQSLGNTATAVTLGQNNKAKAQIGFGSISPAVKLHQSKAKAQIGFGSISPAVKLHQSKAKATSTR